jgi:hypothetical protein
MRRHEEYKGSVRLVRIASALFAAVGLVIFVAGALAAGGRSAAGTPFALTTPGDCATGTVAKGNACVKTTGFTFQDHWKPGNGSATWNVPGRWNVSYNWTVPASVPAEGTTMTLRLAATELTRNPGARICPAIGVTSGFDLKQAQPATLGVCAESGGSAPSTPKTVRLVPPKASPGTIVFLTVGLQDGPTYTYRYRATAPKCRRPSGVDSSTDDCPEEVRFVFTQGGVPKGVSNNVLDMRTVGRGSGSLTVRSNNLSDVSARVVREADFVASPDSRIVLRPVPGRLADGHYTKGPSRQIVLLLEIASSNDDQCSETRGGKPRTASLAIVDRGAERPDIVYLRIAGCPLHSHRFEGKNRVRVVITEVG